MRLTASGRESAGLLRGGQRDFPVKREIIPPIPGLCLAASGELLTPGNDMANVRGGPWLQRPKKLRIQDLSDIFDIWAAAVGENVMITNNVVDRDYERRMSMFP